MHKGGESMFQNAAWFRDNGEFNIMIVTRRGYQGSEGSTVESGELGIFYDVQAAMSHLVNIYRTPMNKIWVYGYCLGGTYATIAAIFYPDIAGAILDRSFPDYFANVKRVMPLIPSFIIRMLYNQVFAMNTVDSLPVDHRILEPKVPFLSSGMSIIHMFKNYEIPDFFFLLGDDDWYVPKSHSVELLRSYTSNNEWDLNQFTELNDVALLHKNHIEFAMNNETDARYKIRRFLYTVALKVDSSTPVVVADPPKKTWPW
jgi:pimeloyl-ACP methyl ester carboxylesterase